MTSEDLKKKEDEINPDIPRIYQTRFCNTCYINRPPVASHCKVCNQCVKHFDHHCNLVNNCIGPRNIWNFFMFSALLVLIVPLYQLMYYIYFQEMIATHGANIDPKTLQYMHILYYLSLCGIPAVLVFGGFFFPFIGCYGYFLYL